MGFSSLLQAAGSVRLRLATTNPAANTTPAKIASTPIEGHNGRVVEGAVAGNRVSSSASMPYVSGLQRISHWIQPDAPLTGNKAPDSIQRGIRKRLMIA